MLDERHARMLEERGLDVELVTRLGVASSPDRGRDWIAIPFVVGGKVVNHKYRSLGFDKRFAQDKDAAQAFWNQDVITDPTLSGYPLVITEGEFDAMAAIQAGFLRTVSVPDGAPAQPVGVSEHTAKYRFLDAMLPHLKAMPEIILATDGDGPGTALREDLALRIGKSRCKWVSYPKGCKDLNDALKAYGVRGVVETINRARYIRVDGIYRMSELPPVAEREAFDIGMRGLDQHFRMRLGDFSVVIGIPNHGKSTVADDWACRMVEQHGWTVAFASFETEPQTDHRRWLRTRHARKLVACMTPEEIDAADRWIDEHFVFIHPTDDDDLIDAPWLLERCEVACLRYGAKLLIIDPWNEIDHDVPPDMTLTQYTGFAIKRFRRLAAKCKAHVMVLVHPTKLKPNKDGTVPAPTLYDASDSAHWANKCDVGITIHREDLRSASTKIIVRKTRYHDAIGRPGTIEALYDNEQSRFTVREDLLDA